MVMRVTPIKTLQRTDNGNLAPVPIFGTPESVAVGTSAATSSVITTPMVMLYFEEATHYAFNATASTAETSHFAAAGERLTVGLGADAYITAKNTA